MTSIKRVAGLGGAVALAFSLTACGGAPTDASVADFCDAVAGSSFQEKADKLEDDDYDGQADLIHDWADDLNEVGTPEDISDEAREGFEIAIDTLGDISADDLEEAAKKDEDPSEFDLEGDDKKKVDAFQEYQGKTCAEEGGAGGEETE